VKQKEIKKITNYIFLKSNPQKQKADLALVFGTHRSEEAINKTYELYRDKFINKILVSGGVDRVTSENEALILEKESTNSLENVLFSKKVIDEKFGFNNIKKIIAVVKHYHSRRALMTLKKYFPKDIELIPVTYEIYGFTKDNWFKSDIGKEKVISEFEKISKYLDKGDIGEL